MRATVAVGRDRECRAVSSWTNKVYIALPQQLSAKAPNAMLVHWNVMMSKMMEVQKIRRNNTSLWLLYEKGPASEVAKMARVTVISAVNL